MHMYRERGRKRRRERQTCREEIEAETTHHVVHPIGVEVSKNVHHPASTRVKLRLRTGQWLQCGAYLVDSGSSVALMSCRFSSPTVTCCAALASRRKRMRLSKLTFTSENSSSSWLVGIKGCDGAYSDARCAKRQRE